MNLGGLSAVYPGFMAARQQEGRNKAQELTNQDALDDRASMEALGRAFGMPQPAPPPQGAGQPSVPRQPAPQPQMAPQGNPAAPAPQGASPMLIPAPGGPPTGMPIGNAPPPQPQQAPSRPPMSQGASGGQSAPQGGGQPQSGMMSLEQLTQRIRAANPGIEKNPRVLVKALERGQVLLAPEGRQELAAAKQQLAAQALDMKIQQFQMTMEQKEKTQLTAAEKMQMQGQVLDLKRELAQAAQAGMDRRGAETRDAALTALLLRLTHDDKKTEGKNRVDLVKAATKAGVPVDPAWETADIQKNTAEAVAKKFAQTEMPDETAKFIAEASKTDPSILSRIGSGPSGNANRAKVWGYLEKSGMAPAELAAARVALTGKGQEARTVGAQAGSVALGVKELDKFGPMVIAASDKLDRTQYPTVNRLVEAAQKGTGGTQIVTLANNIQALKNAYTQVLTRGGRPSDAARKQASDLIDEAWSKGQIKAAVAAMKQEAAAAGKAAKEAASDISDTVGGKTATPDAAAASEDDPYGLLK